MIFESDPNPLTEMVLKSVMVILDKEETWPAAQEQMENPKFLENLKTITSESLT